MVQNDKTELNNFMLFILRIFCIQYLNTQNTLFELQSNIKYVSYRVQLLHVSAPRCRPYGVGSYLNCVLELRSFVVIKLPEDGLLVPKHVVVCT